MQYDVEHVRVGRFVLTLEAADRIQAQAEDADAARRLKTRQQRAMRKANMPVRKIRRVGR